MKSRAAAYKPTPDRYWLTRHYVALSTIITLLIMLLAPGSLSARALHAAGLVGDVVVPLLMLVSLASLFEGFVTAFVPRRHCEWLRRQRHLLFMGIGLGQLSLAYVVIAYAPDSMALLLRFSLDATVAALVAYLDLFARHQAASTA